MNHLYDSADCSDHYLAANANFLVLSDFNGSRGILMVFDNNNITNELLSHQGDGNCTVSNLSVIRKLRREEMVIESGGFTILSRNFSLILQVTICK